MGYMFLYEIMKAATGQHTRPHKRHYIAAFMLLLAVVVVLSFGCSLLIVWACAVIRPPFYILGVLSMCFNSIDSGTGSELWELDGIPRRGNAASRESRREYAE